MEFWDRAQVIRSWSGIFVASQCFESQYWDAFFEDDCSIKL